MRATNWLAAVMMACVLGTCIGCAFAQDWPQWRGPARDGKVAAFTAPPTWPAAFTQKWKVSVGAGDGTPALVGDRLYVFTRQGDQEVISCLNAGDGSQVWQDKYTAPAATGPSARQHPGPRSSPAVAEGKVVTLGLTGIVSCLDAAEGKLVWRKDPFPGAWPRFYTGSSPLITDGVAIAYVGGPGNGALVAFDLATGDEKWRWGGEGPDYSSPVLMTVEGTKQVVSLSEKGVVGVSAADGKLLWQVPFAPAGMAYNAATPIIDGQTVIYTGSGRGTHAVKIEKKADGFAATEVWNNPEIGCQFCTPVLQGGMLYGLSRSGNLFCVDAQTGKTAWSDATARDRGGFGAMVNLGSAILALPSSGELVILKPDSAQYSELGRVKVAETATYACPVVAGNRVFVKDADSVTLWTLP
jgi:outer membrane protein assembly factor BamB